MPHEPLTKHEVKETVQTAVENVVPIAIHQAVAPAVKEYVNGNVQRVETKLDQHIKDQDDRWDDMEPLLEFGRTMGSIRKAIIWLTQPIQGIIIILAALGGLIAFFKHIL